MKNRASWIYGRIWGIPSDRSKLGDNISCCSCWMCGNPRKYFGERTLQEIKFYDGVNDDER